MLWNITANQNSNPKEKRQTINMSPPLGMEFGVSAPEPDD